MLDAFVQHLRELDPVSVRVEDVEQAHLAVQLEHDADVDARGAQTLGLRLDVVDVDRGVSEALGAVSKDELQSIFRLWAFKENSSGFRFCRGQGAWLPCPAKLRLGENKEQLVRHVVF